MYNSAIVLCAAALLTVSFLQQDLGEGEAYLNAGKREQEDPPPHRDRVRQPVELRDNTLIFSDRFSLRFQRTLRIPDDGGTYPLPPGLGAFPVYRVRDYADHVPEGWDQENGYFIPMYQREAMWIDFDGAWWKPNAVKVGVGLVNAVSGGEWNLVPDDDPQDYVVVPDQPWLDGIKSGEGTIRQFVAVPLGSGYSVEAQVTGKESDGALRIAVFEPKAGRFPDHPPQNDRFVLHEEKMSAMATKMDGAGMGIGAGGSMKQKVYEDGYGLDTWQQSEPQEIVIYIINSEQFEAITGLTPPTTPVDAATYTSYGFPWFALYDEHKTDLPASSTLKHVKSTGELDKQKHINKQSDSSVVVPDSQVIKLQ
ncbi:MAG: hypothetical protein WBQ23_08050 [Bacteroidota bacterium]